MIRAAVVAFLLCLIPSEALPATWCVPNALIGGTCPNVAPTIQAALNAIPDTTSHVVRVGPGVAPQRLVVAKRASIQCLPGAKLSDAGLPLGDILVEYRGPLIVHGQPLKSCPVEVSRSAVGIYIPHNVQFFGLVNSTVTRIGPRAGIGLLVDGTGSIGKVKASRAHVRNSIVQGFAQGGVFLNAFGINPEGYSKPGFRPVIWRNNGVGLTLSNINGQVFYNDFEGNGVGLHFESVDRLAPRSGAHDINSNRFTRNTVAVQWDRCTGSDSEFNHNVFTDNTTTFRVETDPGLFLQGDTAYHEAWLQGGNQFANVRVCHGGVCTAYDIGAFAPTPRPCP